MSTPDPGDEGDEGRMASRKMSVREGREDASGAEGETDEPQMVERRRLQSCASTICAGVHGVAWDDASPESPPPPPAVEVEKDVTECDEGDAGPFEADAAESDDAMP